MRLSSSVGTLPFRFSEEKVFELFSNAGFDALDISFFNQEEYIGGLEKYYPLGNDYIAKAERQKKLLDKFGLICNQAHSPYGLSADDSLDFSSYHFTELVRSLEAATILGAPHTVIHPIKPERIEDVYSCNVRMFEALLPYCEKFNIKIALETCHLRYRQNGKSVVYFDSAKKYCDIISALNSPYITACIDLGHTAGGLSDYPEKFIKEMQKGLLTGLHVQDCDYMHDNHTTPFFQKLNWDNIMKALADIEYSGDLTFEDVNIEKHFPDELIKSIINYKAKVGRYLISLFENSSEKK